MGSERTYLPALRKPDRMTAAGRIFHDVCHDGEAVLAEQGAVFGAVKALVDRSAASSFAKATGTWPA